MLREDALRTVAPVNRCPRAVPWDPILKKKFLVGRIGCGRSEPNLGTCPDFGNTFKTEEQRHAGLTMMFPYAKICHAKTLEFNAQGEMTSFDFPACVALAEKAGFQGVYSIEFEGSGDPMQGVTWTLAILKKALA